MFLNAFMHSIHTCKALKLYSTSRVFIVAAMRLHLLVYSQTNHMIGLKDTICGSVLDLCEL